MRHRAFATVSAGVIALILSGDRAARTAAQQPLANPLPGVRLSLDELKQQFFQVSAGRRLKPRSWPNNGRVAVALSFDVDNATIALSQGNTAAGDLSRGEYGAIEGLPRILRLLDRHNIAASFFIPAVSAALHPHMVDDILSRQRHEIGVHGWIHEQLQVLNNEAEERRLLNQSIEYLSKAIGKRPVGYRAPSWAFSRYTMKLVKDAGFLYDSSLMASDDAYEVLLGGQPAGVVELPIEWILDDSPYFGATANGSLPSAELALQTFQSEFDVAYEEGGLFVLTMHPHLIGHRSRIVLLDRLIAHIKSKRGVWFATHEQVAQYVKTAGAATP
jgi:peptidoglycan/xylan/chitin deacetylase (PgdA/CDA1 family)